MCRFSSTLRICSTICALGQLSAQLRLLFYLLRAAITKLESEFEQQCLGPSQKSFGELKRKLIVAMPAFNDALAQRQLVEFFEWLLVVLAVTVLVSFVFLVLMINWEAAFTALSDLVDNFSGLTFGERLSKLSELFKKSVGYEKIWARCYFYSIGLNVLVAFGGTFVAHLWCVAPIEFKSHVSSTIYTGIAGVIMGAAMVVRHVSVALMSPSPHKQRRRSSAPLSPAPALNFSNDTTSTSESESPSPWSSPTRDQPRRRVSHQS